MRLRRPCKHDQYDPHVIDTFPLYFINDPTTCPGGEFLSEGALVIEKVEGEWPEWASRIVGLPWFPNDATQHGPLVIDGAHRLDVLLETALAAFQVGEPGK